LESILADRWRLAPLPRHAPRLADLGSLETDWQRVVSSAYAVSPGGGWRGLTWQTVPSPDPADIVVDADIVRGPHCDCETTFVSTLQCPPDPFLVGARPAIQWVVTGTAGLAVVVPLLLGVLVLAEPEDPEAHSGGAQAAGAPVPVPEPAGSRRMRRRGGEYLSH